MEMRKKGWLFLQLIIYTSNLATNILSSRDIFCNITEFPISIKSHKHKKILEIKPKSELNEEKTSKFCCYRNGGELGKCLPSFIIAGAQKSGTTALAGYLSHNKYISFSKKKEPHHFSKFQSYDKGIAHYFEHFRFWNFSKSPFVLFGEATPYYIASKHACKRIAQTIPDVKLIVMVRSPVDRAYSEYQMKLRRVHTQEVFLSKINENAVTIRKCLINHPKDWRAISSCVPFEITQLPHWSGFIKEINVFANSDKNNTWILKINECFSNSMARRQFTKGLEFRIKSDTFVENRRKWHLLNQSRATDFIWRQFGKANLVQSIHTYASNYWERVRHNFEPYRERHLTTFGKNKDNLCLKIDQKGGSKTQHCQYDSMSSMYFDAEKCMKRGSSERIQPLFDVFYDEMQYILACGGADLYHANASVVNDALQKCIEPVSGISGQYIYRSLYYPQIKRCIEHISKRNILFISSEKFKESPIKELKKILWFLNLPGYSLNGMIENNLNSEDADNHNIQHMIDAQFPGFESRTGWRLKSEYDPIPDSLRRDLQDFFRPFNSLFFQLIGRTFEEWK